MFTTDAAILQRVADALRQAIGSLDVFWSRHVTEGHTAAYQDIVGRLLGRGFVLSQITAWDRGAEFETDIGVYWALVKGAALDGFSDLFIQKIDRRSELDKMATLQVAGVWQKPGSTTDQPGMVSTSNFDTSGSVFNPFDPDDPRVGQPIRW